MVSKNFILIFKKSIMYKPIIYRLVKDFDIIFNVLEAKIYPKEEGRIILELKGSKNSMDSAIKYIKNEGVIIDPIINRINKDENLCVHCGACTAVCRAEALSIDRETMKINFYPEKCTLCGLCLKACPVGAMSGTSIDI